MLLAIFNYLCRLIYLKSHMSGFNKGNLKLPEGLIEFSHAIIHGDEPLKAVKENKQLIDNISPEEVIVLIDELAGLDLPRTKLRRKLNRQFLLVMLPHPILYCRLCLQLV